MLAYLLDKHDQQAPEFIELFLMLNSTGHEIITVHREANITNWPLGNETLLKLNSTEHEIIIVHKKLKR